MNAEIYELPEGWVWTRFQDIAEVISDLVDPADYHDSHHIAPNHIESFTGRLLPYATIAVDGVKSPKHRFHPGQILYSKIRPYLCKAVQVHFNGLCSADMYPVSSKIDTSYLHRWLISPRFTEWASNHDGRTLLPKINQEALATIPVPVPPLAEQSRIVEKVEALLASVSTARERLAKVPVILKRFRQSVLTVAYSGRLTANYGPGGIEDSDLHSTWEKVSLGELLCEKPQNGIYKPQSDYGTGTRILRIDNFYEGQIEHWCNLKRVKLSSSEIEQYGLANGELVINRVNSIKFLGKSGLVRGLSEPCVFESNMMRLRLDRERVAPEYLVSFLSSPSGLTQLRKNAKHAINQSSINQRDVLAVDIPLPSRGEQEVIVHRVEALFKLADAIEKRVAAATQRADKLTQAILAKAFRGELVPTEAELARAEGREYETASALLERIRAEHNHDNGAVGQAHMRRRLRRN